MNPMRVRRYNAIACVIFFALSWTGCDGCGRVDLGGDTGADGHDASVDLADDRPDSPEPDLEDGSRVTWAITYGGSDHELARAVRQTSDGGFIVAGETASFGAGNKDMWILKLDSSGEIQWEKAYGGAGSDRAYDVQPTTDGGFIVAGETDSFGAGESDAWVLRLDASGNALWQKTYGGTAWDLLKAVQQTSDGGYVTAGETSSFGELSSTKFWVVKLDAAGNMAWQNIYQSGWMSDMAESVQQTSDGGYIVGGENSLGDTKSYWIIKLDSAGNVSWQEAFPGYEGSGYYSDQSTVRQCADGGYVFAGILVMGSGYTLCWAFKLDAAGTVVWQNGYAHDSWDVNGAFSIQQTSDGGYVMAGGGKAESNCGSISLLVFKLAAGGEISWARTYSGESFDGEGEARSIQETADHGLVVAGSTPNYSAGSRDVWVIRTDSAGRIADSCPSCLSADLAAVTTPSQASPIVTTAVPQPTAAVITDTAATPLSTSAVHQIQCSR